MAEELDLFDTGSGKEGEKSRPRPPLADRMRPATLDEFAGQEHLVGKDGFLRQAIDRDEIPSLILWGPPGSGKTTIARIISNATKSSFISFSAVTSGIKDIREVISRARHSARRTILFVDEIHRFNKAQQDAFLPHVENGTIVLIGATTENPSFEVNSPLLSRSRVLVLNSLSDDHIRSIIENAISDAERGVGGEVDGIEPKALEALVSFAGGDARKALNTLEQASLYAGKRKERTITAADIETAAQKKTLLYDRAGEEHYNIISALHKSMRGSDPDASLYWFARMLEGGEDPLYIARRIVRFAAEDVGMADPHALLVAQAAVDAYHFLGTPEGELAIAEAIVYCATAPKSNALYIALSRARGDARKHGALPVPMHIRNAPTRLMKNLGYGDGYQYDHNTEDSYSGQEHLPEQLIGTSYYRPGSFGFEKTVAERMNWWEERKKTRRKHRTNNS